MQIGISARGLSTPVGGARRLLDELLRVMPAVARDHRVFAFQPPCSPIFPGVTPVWVKAPYALWWEQVALARQVRRHPPDVLLAPKSLLPPRLPRSVKTVSMVLDLFYFRLPSGYLHEYKWRDILAMRLLLRRSCERADAIVCISEATRSDLLSLWPSLGDKTSVVPLGVRTPSGEAVSASRIAAVRARHNLSDRPYVLYVGSLSPRKNMTRGVRAFAQIAHDVPHALVVTAGKSWRDTGVEAEVERQGLRDRFCRLGIVEEAEMPALYAGADTFFFPSLGEGFGLPVLEAMACGCPVAASTAEAVREAAGDAALLADPLSETALADALRRILTTPSVAAALRAAGHRRAAQFTWERTGARLLRIMQDTVRV